MTTTTSLWYIRPDGQKVDTKALYDQYPNLFSIRFHHEGRFTELPNRKYVGGQVTFVDLIAIDQFNIDLMNSLMYQSLGFDENVKMHYHYKVPMKGLDIGLKPLVSENDFYDMLKHVPKHKILYVYVEHGHTNVDLEAEKMKSLKHKVEIKELDSNVTVVDLELEQNEGKGVGIEETNASDDEDQSESEYEQQSQSEDEQQSDESEEHIEDIVDEEHIIDESEVKVNMTTFTFQVESDSVDPMQPIVKISEDALEVIDYDSFEDVGSDTEYDRRKGLRKLRKAAGASTIINSLDAGQEFANRDEAKDRIRAHSVETRRNIMIIKNDKHRVRAKCYGIVPESVKVTKESILNRQKTNEGKGVNDDKGKGKSVNAKEDKKPLCPWVVHVSKGDKGK